MNVFRMITYMDIWPARIYTYLGLVPISVIIKEGSFLRRISTLAETSYISL